MRKQLVKIYFLVTVFLLLPNFALAQVVAFPGAEGFGANTLGGRGGAVIKVTNLNDSGAGSFRAAVTTSGARTVVLEVSGIINLASDVNILTPFITIAGQTSPGGVTIAGATVMVNTHDVIIRHMRFRPGTNRVVYERDVNGDIIYYDAINVWPTAPGACLGNIVVGDLSKNSSFPCPLSGGMDPELIHGLIILGRGWGANTAYNIIIDHCSVSWGVDETLGVTGGAMGTTIQWTIVSEGLAKAGHSKGEHSKGLMISGKPNRYDNAVSIHHNYIAHNTDRNPMMFSPQDASYPLTTTIDGRNNISYNWYGNLSAWAEEIPHVNWVDNYAKQGLESNATAYEVTFYAKPWVFPTPLSLLYIKGNIGSTRLSQNAPDWNVGWYYDSTLCPEGWSTSIPWEAPPVTTEIMSYNVALNILSDMGATKPVRDSVDARVTADFAAGTGRRKVNVAYPDDYPVFDSPAILVDTDNDGMADDWEITKGLNSADATDRNDIVLAGVYEGYTYLDYYLGELAGDVFTAPTDIIPPNVPSVVSVN